MVFIFLPQIQQALRQFHSLLIFHLCQFVYGGIPALLQQTADPLRCFLP